MRRVDALSAIYERLHDGAVVTIMGAVAAELQSTGTPRKLLLPAARDGAGLVGGPRHRAGAPHAAGGCTGRGRLVADEPGRLEHDGSLPAGNLVHVVFDNESLLSVGGFPTATSSGTDLAAVAQAAGVPRTAMARTAEELVRAFDEARASKVLTTIVVKVEAIGPSAYVTDLGLLENRFRFQRYLRA